MCKQICVEAQINLWDICLTSSHLSFLIVKWRKRRSGCICLYQYGSYVQEQTCSRQLSGDEGDACWLSSRKKPSIVPWGAQPIRNCSYPTNERPLPSKEAAYYCPSPGLPASLPQALSKQGPLPGSLELPVLGQFATKLQFFWLFLKSLC